VTQAATIATVFVAVVVIVVDDAVATGTVSSSIAIVVLSVSAASAVPLLIDLHLMCVLYYTTRSMDALHHLGLPG
jgi:hypothetical protein